MMQSAADTILASPTLLTLALAFLLSPHFALIARYIVKATPNSWDNQAVEIFLEILKIVAGHIEPKPEPDPANPDAPVDPEPAKRGILSRLLFRR